MLQVKNSYAPLKKVLMHRPGNEILRVTRDNAKRYNISFPINLDMFQYEYDCFLNELRKNGAEPVLIGEVLKDDKEAMEYIANRPNVMYTRDLSAMVGKGLVIMSMGFKGRSWDPWLVRRAAKKLGVPVLGEIGPEGVLEGGGVEWVTDGVLAAGFCDRANEMAFVKLRKMVLEGPKPQAKELAVIMLPEGTIHIDGLFLPLDKDLAIAVPDHLDMYPTAIWTKGGKVRYTLFTRYLKEKGVETLPITCKEGQNCAANWIQLGPRKMLGYEGNSRVEREIEKRGGTVATFPGYELIKGRGGPHCMTCPILRKH